MNPSNKSLVVRIASPSRITLINTTSLSPFPNPYLLPSTFIPKSLVPEPNLEPVLETLLPYQLHYPRCLGLRQHEA